ncbi:MAG: flavin reductase family protein [Acidimicrobiia bacterium]
MAGHGGIHDEHPFAPPPELRDPVRRFRGRLSSPVTVVTSGGPGAWTGLTVSSLMVAEGEPSRFYFLAGTTSDLWYAIEETGVFVVHVLEEPHAAIAQAFAGLRPSPGGPFAGLEVVDGRWGPELVGLPTRLYCRFQSHTETTYHALVEGIIERVDLDDLTRPLQYFRGAFRRLSQKEE